MSGTEHPRTRREDDGDKILCQETIWTHLVTQNVKRDVILSEMISHNRIYVILWFDDCGSISLRNNSESHVPIHPHPQRKEKTHIQSHTYDYNTTYIQYIYIHPKNLTWIPKIVIF